MTRTVIRIAAALSLTAGVAFAGSALAFSFWPSAGIGFLNTLFDGVDFSGLARENELFDYAGFLASLGAVMGAAFALGAVFAVINHAIGAWQTRRPGPAVDPVCGMEVDPETAAGPVAHAGREYYFCCDACRDKFIADARRYLGGKPTPPVAHA